MLAALKEDVGGHYFMDFPSQGLSWYDYKMGMLEDVVSEHGVWSHTDVGLNPSCHSLAVWPGACCLTSLSFLLYKMKSELLFQALT